MNLDMHPSRELIVMITMLSLIIWRSARGLVSVTPILQAPSSRLQTTRRKGRHLLLSSRGFDQRLGRTLNHLDRIDSRPSRPALSLSFTDYHNESNDDSFLEDEGSVKNRLLSHVFDDDDDDDEIMDESANLVVLAPSPPPPPPTTTTTTVTNKPSKADLKEELKSYRVAQASSQSQPAFRIFTNAVLDDICRLLPTTLDELMEIKGVGPKKLEAYGDDIIDIVQKWMGEEGWPAPGKQRSTPTKPAKIPASSLTKEQKEAADFVLGAATDNSKNGDGDDTVIRNVFISGAAGVGKSHLIKYILQTFQERGHKYGVCAPTGVAALHVGGSTLHSFFGIGLGTGKVSSLVRKVAKNKEAMKRIDQTDTLIIDEVSMLSSDLLETLDDLVRQVRREGKHMDRPFGGMQIIAVGDFFQLPPVFRGSSSHGSDRDDERPFCFDSYVWQELGLSQNTIQLHQIQRQESGSKFAQFLNLVRTGHVTQGILQDLNEKCLVSPHHPLPADGITPTRLYVLNRDVDSENDSHLAALESELMVCQARDEWTERMPADTSAAVKRSMKESLAAEMPDQLKLKVGAQVMLTRNKDIDRGLVNGSRGVITRFVKDVIDGDPVPIVRFDCGAEEKIGKESSSRFNPDGGKGCLVRKQIPLRLAWAMTVHKCQGTTLSRAILDISSVFESGQAYVALSRVKSIDGLWLERPVRMNNILVSSRVAEYYENRK